jgi:hypothetical protein
MRPSRASATKQIHLGVDAAGNEERVLPNRHIITILEADQLARYDVIRGAVGVVWSEVDLKDTFLIVIGKVNTIVGWIDGQAGWLVCEAGAGGVGRAASIRQSPGKGRDENVVAGEIVRHLIDFTIADEEPARERRVVDPGRIGAGGSPDRIGRRKRADQRGGQQSRPYRQGLRLDGHFQDLPAAFLLAGGIASIQDEQIHRGRIVRQVSAGSEGQRLDIGHFRGTQIKNREELALLAEFVDFLLAGRRQI